MRAAIVFLYLNYLRHVTEKSSSYCMVVFIHYMSFIVNILACVMYWIYTHLFISEIFCLCLVACLNDSNRSSGLIMKYLMSEFLFGGCYNLGIILYF